MLIDGASKTKWRVSKYNSTKSIYPEVVLVHRNVFSCYLSLLSCCCQHVSMHSVPVTTYPSLYVSTCWCQHVVFTNKNPVSRPQWHKQCIYGLDTYWGLVKNTSKWRHWLPFLGKQINKQGNWHILHMFSSCILSVPPIFIVFIPLPFISVCPRLVYCIVSSPPFKVSIPPLLYSVRPSL